MEVRATKHDDLANHLANEILTGQYRVGERLPSERDLAARFTVNRGAVREAMKRLAQMGLAKIQPGGARVAPVQEASLDVIGHLLALGPLPDAQLIDQILTVVNSLVQIAAATTLRTANDNEIEQIIQIAESLYRDDLGDEEFMLASLNLMAAIMTASGNLPCQLIARALLEQLLPRMSAVEAFVKVDYDTRREYARQLHEALAARDVEASCKILTEMSQQNRTVLLDALQAAQQHNQNSDSNISNLRRPDTTQAEAI